MPVWSLFPRHLDLNYALNPGSIHPASGQDISRLGSNHEVLLIDRAFHTAGLIRPFERGSWSSNAKTLGTHHFWSGPARRAASVELMRLLRTD